MDELMRSVALLYASTHIPAVLTDGSGNVLFTWPKMPKGYVDAHYFKIMFDDFRLQKRDGQHPIVFYLEPGYFSGVMKLGNDCFCLLGPVSPTPHSSGDVLAFNSGAVAVEYLPEFCTMMLSAPLMDFEQLRGTMRLLSRLACGTDIDPQDVMLCDNTAGQHREDSALTQSLFTLRETNDLHVSTDFEQDICAAIQAGDCDKLVRRLKASAPGRVGVMSQDALRQCRYIFISFSLMVSRAAIRGGLPQETAFSLSDIYCQRMDLLPDKTEIETLSFTMALDFCARVAEQKTAQAFSAPTRKCMEYISQHLHEPLRLEELSKACGLCTRSLSLHFKKEMGQSITDYIHTQRVEEAEYLLVHSRYSLAGIAAFLQYPTQSYFTKIFKAHTGLTPQQYRDNPPLL